MGYDDNTPLTGVTGGGLPAEIWHEVMVRVHEGLPPSPLPMIAPEPRLPPQVQRPAPQEQIAPPSPPEQAVAQASPQENVVTTGQKRQEGLFRNVLNALSGNN
jgi:penicillin-binding protein 1A